MEPITIALKALKRALTEITISPGKIHVDYNDFVDFGDPVAQQAWIMQYKEPEIVEVDNYILNHQNYRGVCYNAFEEEFQLVQKEFSENVKFIEADKIQCYITDILKIYEKIEASIAEDDDGNLYTNTITFEDCTVDQINNSLFKNSYDDFLLGLKKRLRDEIFYYRKREEDLPRDKEKSKSESLSQADIENVTSNLIYSSSVVVNGFSWDKNRLFEKDMIFMFELMTEHGLIPPNTDIKDLWIAFSGKPLQKLLRIKWLVKGKNQQTSKSSLFHFISRLEDFRLIENKEWLGKDNSELYRKLSIIFADSQGKPFTIDGLSSSRSQGLGTRCAMEEEIDKIVRLVAELDTANSHLP